MHLVCDRLVAIASDGTTIGSCPITGSGTWQVGPLVVDIELTDRAPGPMPGTPRWPAHRVTGVTWSVANAADTAVSPWVVAVVWRVHHTGHLRMFRHGYQSWSPCDVATFGVDDDPSRHNPTGIELVQGVHHADQRTAAAGDLRSEFVTVLADADTPAGADTGAVLVGFDAGVDHDGTLRLRHGAHGGPELWVEALLGGARTDPATRRPLHSFGIDTGAPVGTLLEQWAARVGTMGSARTTSPFQVGWCSWYHYFHDVTERHLRENLAAAGSWPFDVFQLDDGFQAAIGDWLHTNDKFPTDVDNLAAAIAATGATPGIWLAPFIAAPDSDVATRHPGWMARDTQSGGPLPGMFNPPWGGGMGGVMLALDTTHPEVVAHLESVARQLRDAGFNYLKLDFTFAPSFDGQFADPTLTPAQRVRAGYDAIRRGAGEDCFILGCGAPISHVVGAVDGNRIGSDVDPRWTLDPDRRHEAYPEALPATVHAFRNTVARSFMHRSLWLNDPDCVMLRTTDTDLAPHAMRAWAATVALSGGMVLVSDDLALLDSDARALFDDVVAVGRAVDTEAAAGNPPTCTDLLDTAIPTTITSGGRTLVVDPTDGRATVGGSSLDAGMPQWTP